MREAGGVVGEVASNVGMPMSCVNVAVRAVPQHRARRFATSLAIVRSPLVNRAALRCYQRLVGMMRHDEKLSSRAPRPSR